MKTNQQAHNRATDWAAKGEGVGVWESKHTSKQGKSDREIERICFQVNMDNMKFILMKKKAANERKQQLSSSLSMVAEKYATSVNRKVVAHVHVGFFLMPGKISVGLAAEQAAAYQCKIPAFCLKSGSNTRGLSGGRK